MADFAPSKTTFGFHTKAIDQTTWTRGSSGACDRVVCVRVLVAPENFNFLGREGNSKFGSIYRTACN